MLQKYANIFDFQKIICNFAHMNEITQIKKPRLEWLDALRGFTMIMVVAYHVAQMGFGESWRNSSSMPFLVLSRMPSSA